ncbi:MAG TPA: glycosyltransferase family 4 protein [Thermoanaerobaculia bacterium]|nr:glycosyltransferase family 4 protein [Thermoanaerobaculia bacterium]
MSRRTVLFVVESSYEVGGLHTRYAKLGRVLPQFGWRAVFALTRGNRFHDPRRLDATFGELETIELDARTGTWDGRVIAIERALGRVKPHVVIPLAGLDAWSVLARRKGNGGPRVVCGMPGIHPRYIALIRRFRGIVDAAYGVSPMTARVMREVAGIAEERVFYVPTGVPIPPFTRDARSRPELRIGLIGRLTKKKRVLDLIPLCEELQRRDIAFSLRVYGEGPLAGALRDGLQRFGDCYRIEGAVSGDTIRNVVLPELDVCLLLSENEGTPNTLLEAMAAGAVVATSDFAGRADLGLPALVFPVGAMDVLAELLANLAKDREALLRLAKDAYDAVKERHSMETMGQHFASMLAFACEGAPMNEHVEVPQVAPAGRLTRIAGPAAAETIRRVLRRRFPHADASEWPTTEGITRDETLDVVRQLEAMLGCAVDEAQ